MSIVGPAPHDLINTQLAAELAQVTPQTINAWRTRGYLQANPQTGQRERVYLAPADWTTYRGRPAPLYRVVDVARAERATATSQRERLQAQRRLPVLLHRIRRAAAADAAA